jgi:hypothetical protein
MTSNLESWAAISRLVHDAEHARYLAAIAIEDAYTNGAISQADARTLFDRLYGTKHASIATFYRRLAYWREYLADISNPGRGA